MIRRFFNHLYFWLKILKGKVSILCMIYCHLVIFYLKVIFFICIVIRNGFIIDHVYENFSSLLYSKNLYILEPSGSAPVSSGALSQNNPVLEGRPVPEEHTWEAVASPFYCASVVHIPGEIEDPRTLSLLSKLNGLLLHKQFDVCKMQMMEPGYTQSLQRELDQTPPEFLAVKLDSMLSRERAKFSTRCG